MGADLYKSQLTEIVHQMRDIRRYVSNILAQATASGACNAGADSAPHSTSKELLAHADDENMQQLERVLQELENTVATLCHLKGIPFPHCSETDCRY